MRLALVLIIGLGLAGCDKLTGAADQKIADAEAIGFACRVSMKAPEACMKENDAQSPSSILDGWKEADADIKAGKLDPTMNSMSSKPKADAAPADEKPVEQKPSGDGKDADAKGAAIKEESKVKH